MSDDSATGRQDNFNYPVQTGHTVNLVPRSQAQERETHPELQGINRNYLGSDPNSGHIRDQSLDVPESEGYGMTDIPHHSSRSPLTPPEANTSYTGASTPNRVHYPPSPLMPHAQPHGDAYTTIPLQDDYNNAPASGSATPHSGSMNKRKWSFLPGNRSSASLEKSTVDEKGAKRRPKNQRGTSWDLLGDRGEWEEFSPKNASVENLRFAEGDVGTNKFSRLYYWALNKGIVVRWAMYIIPVLILFWIPGIIFYAGLRDAKVWTVTLNWWSIWLTIIWLTFWGSTAAFMMLPHIWRNTIAVVIPSAKPLTDIIAALGRYAKLTIWCLAIWVSFTPLIVNHYTGDESATSRSDLSTFANLLFGLFLCSIVYCVEKLLIQLIALQFHRDSYEDRLQEQKFSLKALTYLYTNSHDIPGRSDTLTDAMSIKTKGSQMPKVALRKALKGLKEAAQTTTTALGNVASEMAGQSVLQTNSPANKVTMALTSANKSKALARRLFYSFRAPGAAHLDIQDVVQYFPNLETAQAAFAIFDKDGNGDATRDEIESAVLGIHRERLALEASMRDLDGAVRRLDDIFMVIVIAIAVLILASMITNKITTFVTSAGTFILGLSWLIGTTMQEVLGACIFLFVKHPFDVGDRVDIDGVQYTVAKMQLLSSSFKRVDGKYVWIGHNVLTTKIIENIRRSGAISEEFAFEVAFDTSFEALQALRSRMIAFLKENSRDFLPVFDVTVDDMPAQGKLVLKADIRYKSNWQQVSLKIQRRNKWICALKMALADLKIFGPDGAGNPSPEEAGPTQYTLVPWEECRPRISEESTAPPPPFTSAAPSPPPLMDARAAVNDPYGDIWNEGDELLAFQSADPSRPGTPGPGSAMRQRQPQVPQHQDVLEMSEVAVDAKRQP
ncbi:serine/threonine protein kinase [Cryptococcus neoformans var. grubii Br795]|uniref:Mechanosensitive ion channel protein n=1 Tax=Cryptococcus neoformans Tu259-1 TaxID=1230072 RepID=A0A854QBZ3_CRYNE|nr:serine/threonine protein kinase [Cryptococcus neoformans var. grubii AD1-83a]OWZ51056.1 serine/threonine protein kinase [Cryptococcus neoformans var. grubii 125.91]OXG13124.1 serine/threonine protein kinase [Cryptococcus neoformans var. grubii Tu259-1]OXG27629.1 serine/threonine protein kinase [Cryptococcus neoformans var. grubii Bt15]OXG49681.1 serine/threonine protein kinase [Cryptococcus neoformans var. grubii MW-RSA1955]OXG53821.1 serine/threonine protein kinase [Cryptococcus neoformans